jgi:multimeric flavodoxin WrbA
MKITAIVGSSKKNGKTSSIVKEIINGAVSKNHQCKILHISDLHISDCTGCMKCQKAGKCIIRDDIAIIENEIMDSDVIIWASPVRWGNISGYLLKVIERLFGFLIKEQKNGFPLKKNAKGKKAILVTSCSTSSPFDYIFNQSRSCLNRMKEMTIYSGQKIIKTFVLPGTFGMKEIPDKFIKKARRIGESL